MRRLIPDPEQHRDSGGKRDDELARRLAEWLGALQPAPGRRAGTIDVTPLLHPGPHAEPFLLLHEALENGSLEVVEQGDGVVNTVLARNLADRPVLVLEGESIVGAKQNRVITLDVVLGPGDEIPLPVGCVEQGRWHHTSPSFSHSESPVEPAMRASTSREMSASGRVDQARLWKDVGSRLRSKQVASSSSDYFEYVAQRRHEMQEFLRDLQPLPDQVGVLVLLDGRLLGLDLLGHPANWASLSTRLMKSYVLAGLDVPRPPGSAPADPPADSHPLENVQSWLGRVAAAGVRSRPGAGHGTQLAIEAPGLVGGGLWWKDHVAHLAVFGE